MENTLREGQSFLKLDRAYKKEIETTEKNLSESIMIGKQKLMEKYKLEQVKLKEEQKIENSQEEQKVENC